MDKVTKVSRLQGCKVTRLLKVVQGCTSLQSYIKLQGYKVTRLQSYKVTRLQGYKVTRLQGHKITRSQGHKVTKSQCHKCTMYCNFLIRIHAVQQ